MFSRSLILIVAALIVVSSNPLLKAATRTTLLRQEIRSVPITERPNRPGHFYGNTVRRGLQRRGS